MSTGVLLAGPGWEGCPRGTMAVPTAALRERCHFTWKATGLYKVMRFNRLFAYAQSALIRWTFTLTWTVLTVTLLLSPGNNGSTVDTVSDLFGGTETTDAVGHLIINGILALLWCWTLSLYTTPAKTMRLILIGGLIWCFVGELTQFFVPERGTSLLDLGANILGVTVGLVAYRLLISENVR